MRQSTRLQLCCDHRWCVFDVDKALLKCFGAWSITLTVVAASRSDAWFWTPRKLTWNLNQNFLSNPHPWSFCLEHLWHTTTNLHYHYGYRFPRAKGQNQVGQTLTAMSAPLIILHPIEVAFVLNWFTIDFVIFRVFYIGITVNIQVNKCENGREIVHLVFFYSASSKTALFVIRDPFH